MRPFLFLLALPLAAAVVPVPGTTISLEPPAGLEPAQRFPGFESTTVAITLRVAELAANVATITTGFRDPKRLEAQKMTIDGTEKVTLGPATGELFNFTQDKGGTKYKQMILALGDDKHTILVTGTCEMSICPKWEPALKASLMSVTIGKPQTAQLGFNVTPKGAYKPARTAPGSLALTPNGEFPLKDRRGPMYVASKTASAIPTDTIEEFAESRAKGLPNVHELKITESKAIMLDGLEGHEIVGVANEATPDAAQFVYLVLLKEGPSSYFLLVGIAPQSMADQNLTDFRAMSATFKR